MSQVPNLRIAKVRSEIVNVLLKIYINDSSVLIWQKENEKKRILNTAKISHVDENIGVMHLRSTSGEWSTNIKGELALYFKGDEQSILFKAKNLIIQKNELIVPIPAEVRLLEKRYAPRLKLDATDSKNNLVVQKIFENGKRKQFCVTVIDISLTGVAVAVGRAEAKFFYEGDTVYVIELANNGLKNNVPGKVVYLRPVDYIDASLKTKGFRVGIKFDCYLTPEQLQLFK